MALSSVLLAALGVASVCWAADWEKQGVDGYADSNAVKIHYVSFGKGPLIVMVHGLADFWYTWRYQIPTLAEHHQVVSMDMRGYNLSDKPKGVENYTADKLAGDVLAVIHHCGKDKAVVVGNGWGGMFGWILAGTHPEAVDKLISVNFSSPNGYRREAANNPKQQAAMQYARNFERKDAAEQMTPEGVLLRFTPGRPDSLPTHHVFSKDERARYLEAFRHSDFEAWTNYYKATLMSAATQNQASPLPNVKCPVLEIYGLEDKAAVAAALNNTWDFADKDVTILTLPNAGHWPQWDDADLVTKTIRDWLAAR